MTSTNFKTLNIVQLSASADSDHPNQYTDSDRLTSELRNLSKLHRDFADYCDDLIRRVGNHLCELEETT